VKEGFAAAQESFSLQRGLNDTVIKGNPLTSAMEKRKTFDSLLANHHSPLYKELKGEWTCREIR
jgi:hypothetical protein